MPPRDTSPVPLRQGIVRAPGALPVLGHASGLFRDPLGLLRSLPESGDLVEIRVGVWRAVVVCHPEPTRQVLQNDRIFDKGGPFYEQLRAAIGNGLVSCPYSEHRRQRRMIQPAFHRDRMPGYAEVIGRHTEALVEQWRDGQTIDVPRQMYELTSRALVHSQFTAELAGNAAHVVAAEARELLQGTYLRQLMMHDLIRRLPLGVNKRYRRARGRIEAAVTEAIAAYRRTGTDHGDLLSTLLNVHDTDGTALTDREIHDQLTVILLGGIESTATTLSWAIHLLTRHPKIQDAVRVEARAALGDRTVPAWEDLPRLDLTHRVVKETLRLYPPGWAFTRVTTADTELAGVRIPKGTTVVYSPYLLHHRADCFTDPERFLPDRWSGNDTHLDQRLFLFGGGARKCIGDLYAMNALVPTLASLTARWEFHATTHQPVRALPRITLEPQSLHIRLAQRNTTTTAPTAPR